MPVFQSVLIADHDEKVVGMLTEECETADGTRYELELLESVNLLVVWFADDGSVAVDE